MAAPADPSSLSRSELEAEVAALRGEVAELKQLIMALRAENARLKGLKAPPVIKPSGMAEATTPKRRGRPGRRHGKVVPRVPVETQVLWVAVPPGSQFKGYEPYQVQDLEIRASGALPPRVLANAGRPDHRGPAATGHARSLRGGTAAVDADAVPPRPGDGGAVAGPAAGHRHQHLQARSGAPADRAAGRVPDREPRGAAGRTGDGGLDQRGRHRRAPSRRQRRLHADWQRQFRLVRHHRPQEPAELPRVAARWPYRLCRQRRGAGVHARA